MVANNKGQTLIESAITMMIALPIFISLFSYCYQASQSEILKMALFKSARCFQSINKSNCKSKLDFVLKKTEFNGKRFIFYNEKKSKLQVIKQKNSSMQIDSIRTQYE